MCIMHRGCNNLHITYTSCTEAVASDIDDTTVRVDAVTEHIEAIAAHIEAETAHTATMTAHTVPGTINPYFAPTATAYEKWQSYFHSKGGSHFRVHLCH